MKKSLLLLTPLLFISCKDQPSCESSRLTENRLDSLAEANPDELTAAELLKGLGGNVFTVDFPEDLPKRFYVGLAIKDSDGSITRNSGKMGTSSEAKSVKVFLFSEPDKGGFRYQIVGDHFSTGSFLKIENNKGSMIAPQGTRVKAGDGLIRFSRGNKGTSSGELAGDNFDIILEITPID